MPTIVRSDMVGRMTTSALMTRYVYDFDEPADGGRELLGGKGVGLAEMTQLGVPVPAGFTITTDACRAFMQGGGEIPGLDAEVEEHIARLEEKTGKRFGDTDDPLLVSVRSGAAISMPGMMDTILNLGLSDVRRRGPRGLHRQRAVRARLVPAPDPDVRRGRGRDRREPLRAGARRPEARPRRAPGRRPHARRPRAAARHVPAHLRAGDRRGLPAGRARAAAPRRAGRLPVVGEPARAGLPAHVLDPGRHRHRRERRPDGVRQPGRAARRRASASRATRPPASTGVYGEYLVNAQGEDVVAGIRTPQPVEQMQELLPEAYTELLEHDARGSSSTTATCRTSSSPSRRGTSTSCRPAPRSAPPPRRSRPPSR